MADNILPIRRLTLYKHGVGYVERAGILPATEAELPLVFRQSEVNDALKSLLVLDEQGGQVRGIHYETPGGNFPDENRLNLSTDHSLLDLLAALRGRAVRLKLGEGTAERDYTGRLIGVEVEPSRPLNRSLLTLLEEIPGQKSNVIVLPLAELRSLFLLEDRAEQDLTYLLDSSRSDEAHRTVTIQLDSNQAGHNLLVSYLVPCPTWRVSYRVLAEIKTPEPATPGQIEDVSGELLLQGWGLFDNRLEEDLENVEVRLVAGQPISFVYDLTTSRIPARPVVADEARIAPGPIMFDEALSDVESTFYNGPVPPPPAAPMMAGMAMRAASVSPSRKQMAQSQPVVAKGSDLGELFQYDVTTPVTVKRGESALVPILNQNLPYRHELLYSSQKMPRHPVANLRFKNETGLVLERGPVTVIEDNQYRGEALIAFTPVGSELFLAFAVELGLQVSEETSSLIETSGIQLDGSLLYFNQITTLKTVYQIENKLAAPRVVTIEQPVRTGYELSPDTLAPVEKTAEFYRWKVPCQPRRNTVFSVQERMFNWRTEQVLQQNYQVLSQYLQKNWLTPASLARLKEVLDEQSQIQQNLQEISRLESERGELYRRQEQLRQNMATLATTGAEAELRRRVFEQLAHSEDRLNGIDQRTAQLKNENQQRQIRLDQMLVNLK